MTSDPHGGRTHRWQDWDLADLLRHKQESGLSTSLVVPARNEAATVGDVVTRVREALMETTALLDEIVVVDSDSTDDTSRPRPTPARWYIARARSVPTSAPTGARARRCGSRCS